MENATLPLSARSRVSRPRLQRRRWLWLTLFITITGMGFWGSFHALSLDPPQTNTPERSSLPARVSALGRLAPEGEVVAVAPPTPTGAMAGARVEQLLVAVGDEVKAGQLVAILDTHRSRAATVLEAKAKVEVARAKLAQVKAGANPKMSGHKKQSSAAWKPISLRRKKILS